MADADARQRIDAWPDSREGDFAAYAAAGARDGTAFAREAARDTARFDALNDPAWLRTGSQPRTASRRSPDDRRPPSSPHRAWRPPARRAPPAHLRRA
ncbi:hypothetical protein AB0E87_29630, partial [Streptomyces sp. NPDC029704]